MIKANRVHSTPPTNTPIDPTRRRFLTVAAGASVASVGTLAVAAMPAAVPSIASGLPPQADAELVRAAQNLAAVDQAFEDLHRKHGHDANFLPLGVRRNENIATLTTIQAKSAAGIQAKAASLQLQAMIADQDQHQQIAVSLADDLVGAGPTTAPASPACAADPAFALIAAHRAAEVAHIEVIEAQDEAETKYGIRSDEAYEARDRCGAMCDEVNAICWKLATIPPTTLAGVAAVLRFANEVEDAGNEWPNTDTIGAEGWHYQLRATMAAAIEALIKTRCSHERRCPIPGCHAYVGSPHPAR